MINKYISLLMQGISLSQEQSYFAAKELLQESADPISSGVLISLLHAKGETVDELLGFHKALIEKRRSLMVTTPFVDIVGTGGDKSGTLNISTGGSLLTAALGIPVLKHGNKAVSSNSMFKFFVAKVSRKCTIIARIHT